MNFMYGEEAFKGPTGFRGPFPSARQAKAAEEKPQAENPLAGLSKLFNMKVILLVAIIALIAYWFFFINKPVREISFDIIDNEGNTVAGASVTVYSVDGKEIKALLSGQKISLAEGSYRISVNGIPSGLKLAKGSLAEINVSQDQSFSFKLVPDIKLRLALENFPEQMFAGQALSETDNVNLIVSNESGFDAEGLELEISFPGQKAKPLNIASSQSTFNVRKNDAVQLNLVIEVPSGFKASTSGTIIDVEFNVKGFESVKQAKKITVLPKPDIRIADPLNKRIEAEVLAGSLQQVKAIKVKNSGKIPVNAVNAEIELDESSAEAAGWLSLSSSILPSSGLMETGSEQSTTLRADIPGTVDLAKFSTITGFINFSNDVWTDKIELFLTVKKPSTKLAVSLSKESFDLFKAYINDVKQSYYETESAEITIKNSGQTRLGLGRVDFTTEAKQAGCEDYIDLLEKSLSDLDPAETIKPKFQVSAPSSSACGVGETIPCTIVCKIEVSYTNEFGEAASEEKTLYVNVKE
ncbi:hypothetical protein HZB89_00210 [archaeon]|nr:hypothetical protein [archaeon]